jgi:hypothetical protein
LEKSSFQFNKESIVEQSKLDNFISRYVGMWHESDAQKRHETVHSLWADDAENITRRFVARGMVEIVARVDRAHQEWVASRDLVFRSQGNTDAHNNVVKFFWEMLPRSGGEVQARGLDIMVLQEDGRIRTMYQFSEPLPA